MVRKECTRCQRSSFSCMEEGTWLCPVCGEDLTDNPFYRAKSFQEVNHQIVKAGRQVYLKIYKNRIVT